jgi:hypothetical protein
MVAFLLRLLRFVVFIEILFISIKVVSLVWVMGISSMSAGAHRVKAG